MITKISFLVIGLVVGYFIGTHNYNAAKNSLPTEAHIGDQVIQSGMKQIVVFALLSTEDDNPKEYYSVYADGTGLQKITPTAKEIGNFNPHGDFSNTPKRYMSPDGSMEAVAVTSEDEKTPRTSSIVLKNSQGVAVKIWGTSGEHGYTIGGWSQDGTKVLYSQIAPSEGNGINQGIWVLDVKTLQATEIVKPVAGEEAYDFYAVNGAIDTDRFIYSATEEKYLPNGTDRDFTTKIYSVKFDGSDQKEIYSIGGANWSPVAVVTII